MALETRTLHSFVTNEELDRMAEEKAATSSVYPSAIPEDALAGYIATCWQAAKSAKEPIHLRLLDCLRRKNGEYDSVKLSAIKQLGGVETYLKHTGLKIRAAKSWIKEIILPEGQRPWSIMPTKRPEMPQDVSENIARLTMQEVMATIQATGIPPTPDEVFQYAGKLRDEVEESLYQEAVIRARRMATLIEDQLQEGDHEEAITQLIDDLCTFPAAILKGPEVVRKPVLAWDNQTFTPMVEEKVVTVDRRVSPFDFYPSPNSKNVNDGYIIERMRISRHELESMKGCPGYNDAMIDLVLREHQSGSMTDDVSETERLALEDKFSVHDASGTGDDRLIAHQFWGRVSGIKLLDWGMHPEFIDGETKEYEINALKIGRRVVKAVMNPDPLGRRPYFVTAYEKSNDSIWGEAIPELIAPVQDAMNAVVRALLDNIGLAANPQALVDVTMLDASQVKHATKLWPKKVWLTRSSGMSGGRPPVSFEQFNLISDQLMRVLQKLEQFSDDYSGVPAYTYGNENMSGAGETAAGLNMLLGAASKGIRQVIGNAGRDVVAKRIERQYVWNMLYHEDMLVKGDCKIVARGAMGEVMRQQLKQDRQAFMDRALASEVVLGIIKQEGVAKLLRAQANDLEIHDLVPDEDELMAQVQRDQAMMIQQQQAQQAPTKKKEITQ